MLTAKKHRCVLRLALATLANSLPLTRTSTTWRSRRAGQSLTSRLRLALAGAVSLGLGFALMSAPAAADQSSQQAGGSAPTERAQPTKPSKYCTPFASIKEAEAAVTSLQVKLSTFLAGVGPAAFDLYAEFLGGGVPTMDRSHVTDAKSLEQFRTTDATVAAVENLLEKVSARVKDLGAPELGPPDSPTIRDISDYGDFTNIPIHWGNYLNVPGVIAGGVGSVTIDGVTIPDRRDFEGSVRFIPKATERGVLSDVTLQGDLTLSVLDAVDFCDGDPGWWLEQQVTVPLSRLEVTKKATGGFYGKKTLFDVEVDFDPDDNSNPSHDVTDLFKTNDADDDGVPERQPWSGASYALDNCPTQANGDQKDTDRDGAGDVCDTLSYAKVSVDFTVTPPPEYNRGPDHWLWEAEFDAFDIARVGSRTGRILGGLLTSGDGCSFAPQTAILSILPEETGTRLRIQPNRTDGLGLCAMNGLGIVNTFVPRERYGDAGHTLAMTLVSGGTNTPVAGSTGQAQLLLGAALRDDPPPSDDPPPPVS